ncbi:MAG: hypothetical protein GY835_00995 [bacterium]|nr:hypothetical protein [bacterium]
MSTSHQDICLTHSPLGDEVIVTQSDLAWFPFLIQVTNTRDGVLHSRIPPFAGKYRDSYPCFSPDGSRLYFNSNRPEIDGDDPVDADRLWYVDRTDDGWAEPVYLGDTVHAYRYQTSPSVTRNGTLYFHAWVEEGGELVDADIFRCTLTGGRYNKPERLGTAINTDNAEFHPYIAPDESFIVFDACDRSDGFGGNDLYISYRGEDGSWTPARNLGSAVNTEFADMRPRVTVDGQYLFFTSDRHDSRDCLEIPADIDGCRDHLNGPGNGSQDIYWVEAGLLNLQ